MPVKIKVRSAEDFAATDSRFNAAVRRLAPIIRQLREDPARRSTRKLADLLNGMGQHGPNGKPITPSTMRRILERMPELHLGEGAAVVASICRGSGRGAVEWGRCCGG